MRTRETKAIGVGLALAIGLVALAGCGGDHPASASSPTAQSATTTAASTAASSALPAPSIADGKLLETAVLDSTAECLKIANAQISGVSHANERIAQAQEAHTSLSQQVDGLITLFHRVNPDATIPYGEGRHVTTRQDVLSILEELNKKPPAPQGAPVCAAELSLRLSEGTGIK
jgi:hypothetical protein